MRLWLSWSVIYLSSYMKSTEKEVRHTLRGLLQVGAALGTETQKTIRKAFMMGQNLESHPTVAKTFSPGLIIAAALMIVFGLAEVFTGFSHQFFGLTTAQVDIATYLGVALGLFYFFGGILIFTRKRWAAITAIVLLCGDVLGRIAMVLFGLYPLGSLRQTFGIVVGTAIAIVFAVYVGLKLKSFH